MKYRRWKGNRAVIVALAMAAIVVPAASGKTYEGGSAGYVEVKPAASGTIYEGGSAGYVEVKPSAEAQGYSAQALRAMNERWTKRAESYSQRAGKAAVVSGSHGGLYPGSGAGPGSTVTGTTHPDDRAGMRGPGPSETAVVVSSHGDAFDWSDAGIGASVAALIAAVLASLTMMRRRAGLAV